MAPKRWEDNERERLEDYIQDLREHDGLEGTKTMPSSRIVKWFDLVDTAWGWDKLLPLSGVSWSDCSNYLEEYYLRNARQFVPGDGATTGSSITALAEICLKKEERLASEWKIRINSKTDMILPSKSIILSCLIHDRARSVIRAAGCSFSNVSAAALLVCSLSGPSKPNKKSFLYLANKRYIILALHPSQLMFTGMGN
ncbi:hypothetical protein HU200_056386 [Digitaria exilis]|uniref:Uncharacterized protein n=1 Tax=Digitaria exilis TaxID=1010633 RepID=A0A835ARE6_9POAL|nr:hypothetical protein HU200_056386 [Digitaria exilis]